MAQEINYQYLTEKSIWVWRETLKIHKALPSTRIASSLSAVDIYVALYYGNILRQNPKMPFWPERDRFIISKGHGSISMYPILADLGYYDSDELARVGGKKTFLGAIPDPMIPGYETINGSLGHGLGVGAGIALALRRNNSKNNVFVLVGDGELYEGAVWEAIMFAAHHRLVNLNLVIDANNVSMLNYCCNIIDISPLERRLEAFGWQVYAVNGHDMHELHRSLMQMKNPVMENNRPKVLIAHTKKGYGVPRLESDRLSHIKSLTADEIEELIKAGPSHEK